MAVTENNATIGFHDAMVFPQTPELIIPFSTNYILNGSSISHVPGNSSIVLQSGVYAINYTYQVVDPSATNHWLTMLVFLDDAPLPLLNGNAGTTTSDNMGNSTGFGFATGIATAQNSQALNFRARGTDFPFPGDAFYRFSSVMIVQLI
ncbi:hypothetical protein IC620_07160 [Hazenella sp. IB182357]|uniref:Uncharacterized protein n=1 Tax=Polycladospora coralii TaxID=2771432 RepID=A0A926N5U6_9BACL|nr:hypothetical protein [Polycladospora coralii]MBD1372139.1 hypothetical protein [Polycladospora coralii]